MARQHLIHAIHHMILNFHAKDSLKEFLAFNGADI
jgi:hypothetical protein